MNNVKLDYFFKTEDGFRSFSKSTHNSNSYNFDIYQMMKAFDFYTFCEEVSKKKFGEDHGAILAITDKQYVLTYTAGLGAGPHGGTQARIYAELHGGGKIQDDGTALHLSTLLNQEYINARIIGERYDNQRTEICIIFNLPRSSKITDGMFRNFEKFYIDYNEDIKNVSKKYGLIVSVIYTDANGKFVNYESSSLDEFYQDLKTKVNSSIMVDDNEVIIGQTANNEYFR